MPIYDYTCLKCGHTFEGMCGVDASAVLCRKCSSGMAVRQTGAPAFRINGYTEDNGYGLKESTNK